MFPGPGERVPAPCVPRRRPTRAPCVWCAACSKSSLPPRLRHPGPRPPRRDRQARLRGLRGRRRGVAGSLLGSISPRITGVAHTAHISAIRCPRPRGRHQTTGHRDKRRPILPSSSLHRAANRVLLIARPREAFRQDELEYAVAAGHYLAAGLERARAWDEQTAAVERLECAGHHRPTTGRAAARHCRCWNTSRDTGGTIASLRAAQASSCGTRPAEEQCLRPALGLLNNELRVPEDTGIVGRVIQTGEPCQVDAVAEDLGLERQCR